MQVHQSFTIRLYERINLILEKPPQISGPRWLDLFRLSCEAEVKIKLPELILWLIFLHHFT